MFPRDAVEPPEERTIAEGYTWSPKDDVYGDMRYDEERDKADEY